MLQASVGVRNKYRFSPLPTQRRPPIHSVAPCLACPPCPSANSNVSSTVSSMSAGCLRVALLLVVATITTANSAVGPENIGCLFSPTVCLDGVEWCFDDHAFGRCQPSGARPETLHRFSLRREALHMLQREMERLFALGYRWTHLYTQCVLQVMLESIRQGEDYDNDVCASLSDQDLKGALKAFEGDEEQNLGPNLLARVRFTPSDENPHADFADEVYAPILDFTPEHVEGFPQNVIKAEAGNNHDEESPLRRLLLNKPLKRESMRDRDVPGNVPGVFPIDTFLADPSVSHGSHFFQQYNTPDSFRLGIEAKDLAQALASDAVKSFSRTYNTPDNFRLGVETKDLAQNYGHSLDDSRYSEKDGDHFYPGLREDVFTSPIERELVYDAYREALNDKADEITYNPLDDGMRKIYPSGIYRGVEDRLSRDLELLADDPVSEEQPDGHVFTEGGVVRIADDVADEEIDPDELVRDYGGGWGFKRRERLDVKKPGPNFNLNNYAFKTSNKNPTDLSEKVKLKPLPGRLSNDISSQHVASKQAPTVVTSAPLEIHQDNKADLLSVKKKGAGSPKGSPSLRKIPSSGGDASDDSIAFIKFKGGVGKWTDAVTILRSAAKLLDLDPNAFSHTRVGENEVIFKVDKSKADISATEIAKRIDGIKDKLKSNLGIEITATGSTDKSVSMTPLEEHQLWLLSFLLCGVIAAVAIAGAAFFFVRRHNHSKDKLAELKQPDSEASKDYQELCRARMASKSSQDKPELTTGKSCKDIEAHQSPSSRSSTSSWSEEPALTNMDISTGHMVLSYMEDHLKNKDRLEQEWIALCAYEAEPCATTVAVVEQNIKKNRYLDALPYDHSRVLLNQLVNINGSDYINASTINDHDPRNPAYIATQGPLENTAADLWQMLWEQGSVVMVMLTRLSENGVAMCHRYWPEEGSHVYHIYEVHLVSEHIWCDDYLVRSFYLKNLKTGETRTVTQFHFLSWPENGVPLSTKALLEFRRKVNKSYRGRSCPIVVHCSDGIGRTGTYCLIDMVLNRMAKGAKEIDIAATLEHIRDQRPNMVKTKQQFEFVLMAVAEEVHAILKALPATNSPPPVPKEKE